MLEYINGFIQVWCSYIHTYNVVAYGIVLVYNYWLRTVSFVMQRKVACLCSDSDYSWDHFSVHNKSLWGLDK